MSGSVILFLNPSPQPKLTDDCAVGNIESNEGRQTVLESEECWHLQQELADMAQYGQCIMRERPC